MISSAARNARVLAMVTMAAACMPAEPAAIAQLGEAAVATLGSRDGYVFIFSPLNCSLQGDQIAMLNAIAARSRRSGVVLTAAPIDDSTATAAVAALGIRMRTTPLRSSAFARAIEVGQWRLPLVVAMRQGQVVGILVGGAAERFDTWIEWLEERPHQTPLGGL